MCKLIIFNLFRLEVDKTNQWGRSCQQSHLPYVEWGISHNLSTGTKASDGNRTAGVSDSGGPGAKCRGGQQHVTQHERLIVTDRLTVTSPPVKLTDQAPARLVGSISSHSDL